MKTYTLRKLSILFLTLISFSCSFIDEENTPGIDIQVQLIPYEVAFQYNLYTPEETDPERVSFVYKNNKFSSIINTLVNGNTSRLDFEYNDQEVLQNILIKNTDNQVINTYDFQLENSTIEISNKGEKIIEAVLHNNGLLYSIKNFKKKTISYFTYESGELSVMRTFDTDQGDVTNGTPISTFNFTYSPFGNPLFSSITNVNNLFIINELDEFLLTHYLTTSNNKVNLNLNEENVNVDYRTIFNDDDYPTTISMIYREEGEPKKQIIHSITYIDITPY